MDLNNLKENLYSFIVVVERFGIIERISNTYNTREKAREMFNNYLDMPRFESRDFKFSIVQITPLFIENLTKIILKSEV